MALHKYKINFILEKRKEKDTGKLVTDNVPILMAVTFAGKRLWFYSGYRIDKSKWIDQLQGEKIQRVRKNTVNRDNISASIINARLTELESVVNDIFVDLGKEIPTTDSLLKAIRENLNENLNEQKELSIWEYFDKYIQDSKFSYDRTKQLKSSKQHLKNYAEKRGIKITFEKCNTELLTDLENYLSNDKEIPRSRNTITGIFNRIRAFFYYAAKQKWTKQTPFKDFSIAREVYGDPIYLTKDERDTLFYAELTNERLVRVRDMFVLQCFIGCRVGDFLKLRKSNIINGFIHYVPSKTQDENQKVCKIPLSEKAKSIIGKYDLPDGCLVPYITDQKYNLYLKELFEKVGLTRTVVRMNPLTRQNESVSLCSIVSTHMARRTFIGLLHKTVKNEIIASMSGHVENSKAFHRYYKVDEESQRDAIKTIE